MAQFPASLIYTIYYRKENKIYRMGEGRNRIEITLNQLEKEVKTFTLNAEKYMIIYDQQLLNKMDYWAEFPDKISTDELKFWHLIDLLSEEDYLCFFHMASE
ncbi:MAG: hypothetical protein WDZ91_08200 [Paenibacillaceae bacterium]